MRSGSRMMAFALVALSLCLVVSARAEGPGGLGDKAARKRVLPRSKKGGETQKQVRPGEPVSAHKEKTSAETTSPPDKAVEAPPDKAVEAPPPVAIVAPPVESEKPAARTPALLRKWWFWTAVGGVVAVTAVGVGVGLGTRHAGFADTGPGAVQSALVRF